MRANYKNAIGWIVLEDDTDWLDDEHGSPSVTACMLADVWGKPIETVTNDIRRERERVLGK